jgi:2-succinyl-5-enolpyruvyl-6-hydroxy-3-cyclohexene-1-carboxylate synthase
MEIKFKLSPRERAAHNFAWASAIVDSLVAAGVRHAVLSPGAQMAPISLACRQNERLDCSVIVDERSAAFKALGLARGSATPVLLVSTSGSATGQYYPAIMEANLGMVPLIVLTCDKSPEDHGRGVAQAMDQDRIYSTHVRASHNLRLPDETIDLIPSMMGKLVEASLWPTPGPVHMNVAFRPPLVPEGREQNYMPLPPRVQIPRVPVEDHELSALIDVISGEPGAIVCGPRELGAEFAEAVGALATALRCPLFADSCSGLRFGKHDRSALMTHGDAFLRREKFKSDFSPSWILRFGGTPTSDSVLGWLNSCGAGEQIVVEDTQRWPDPLRQAKTTRIVRAHAATACRQLTGLAKPGPSGWLEAFQDEDHQAERLLVRLNDDVDQVWEAQVIRRLLSAVEDGDTVLVGNSTPIRDFDSFSGTASKAVRLVANRGTNGIDGGVAFLLGLAEASSGRTIGIIGDLAFSHDVGSLQMAASQNVILIVVNNGGGAIFEYQPVAGIPEFDDFLAKPSLKIGQVSEAFGWRIQVVASEADFSAALSRAMASPGPDIIELVVDRRASVARHHQFTSLVADSN